MVANPQLEAFTPAPAGSATPYGGWGSPCGKLMKARPAQVVYGPGTFLNRAVAAVNTEIAQIAAAAQQTIQTAKTSAYQLALARHLSKAKATALENAAGQIAQQQETTNLLQMYLNSGISGQPKIDDPQFIPQIVFDQTRGVNQPKARFAYLFPTANSALIQVRLKASLTPAQQAQAITWIRQAVQMPMFRSAYHGTYTVSGVPVVTDELASTITGSIAGLLAAALVVMGVVLLLVFRSRPRLLPLGIALAAAGITFGAVSLVGGSLTMASIAVLPILIGLAVDYAIQFQSRTEEAGGDVGSGSGRRQRRRSRPPRWRRPPASWCCCCRRCRWCAGSGCCWSWASASRSRARSPRARRRWSSPAGGGRLRIASAPQPAVAGHRRRVGARSGGDPRRAPGLRCRRARGSGRTGRGGGRRFADPAACWLVGLVLAAAGWVADTQMPVQSDVTKLVPSNMPALRGPANARARHRRLGRDRRARQVGERGDAEDDQLDGRLREHAAGPLRLRRGEGLRAGDPVPGAVAARPVLLGRAGAGASCGSSLTPGLISSLLAAVPPYFSQAVITPDHREATLAFGIRLMPLSRQQRVIDYMRAHLHPPAGVSAELAGLPVLAAQADASLSSSGRRMLTLLAGLVAVGLVLLAVLRTVGGRWCPLVPIALATGWSSLILFATGIPLNPMSATLGALVIAISTEFSVLLSERFRARSGARVCRPPRRWRGRTGSPARRCSPPASPRSPGSACSCSRASRCCATSGS